MIRKFTHEEIKDMKPSPEEVKQKTRTPLYVLCNNIRSLHNVGAIFRTCDGVLVEKVYLCGFTGFPPRKEISKTALGAEELVPWEYHESAVEVVKMLKAQGVQVVALELTEQSVHYFDAEYEKPTCVVIGNEIEGVDDEVLELCDGAVDIPMLGRANSLNVATALGICLYEVARQVGGFKN